MNRYLAPVITNQELMHGIYLLWLECPQIASIALPGQFIMLNCGEGTLLRRPISIHRVDEERIALLYSPVGKGTRWLSQRHYGESLDLLGLLGNGFSIDAVSCRLLLLAGGIGIAPLYLLAQTALQQGKDITLLLGGRTVSQVYPHNLLPRGIRTIVTTDDGTAGHRGPVTDLLPEYAGQADRIYACGPAAMYRTMAQSPELQAKPVQVSLEMRMACGSGVCYGCTIRTKNGLKQVCKDGPVFNLSDVVWDEMFKI